MSYSYIKSVFPNFENSNKVYDETLYNNITTLYTDSGLGLPKPENLDKVKVNYNQQARDDVFVTPDENILANRKVEGMTNTYEYSEVPLKRAEHQDNLKFYELPLKSISIPNNTLANVQIQQQQQQQQPQQQQVQKQIQVKNVEGFEGVTDVKNRCLDMECDQYIKHILECSKCKSTAMKQLGIESDRFRNEEMMEVASYIIFGLFILLLIDSLKGKGDK
jgi:hypothetical protein